MRIIDHDKILDILEKYNGKPTVFTRQVQIHMLFKCGCTVVQDKIGSSLFSCKEHKEMFSLMRDNQTIHRVLH